MNPPKVIVIGAGLGGITAAIHLANRGCQVTVYEKNDQPMDPSPSIPLRVRMTISKC